MAIYDVYCVGMRKELFPDEGPSGHAFDMEPIDNERVILFCTIGKGYFKFICP